MKIKTLNPKFMMKRNVLIHISISESEALKNKAQDNNDTKMIFIGVSWRFLTYWLLFID